MAGDPLKKGRYTNFGNKIGLFSNKTGNFICNSPEVVLNFPFKDTVLEAGMTKEDAGREERFLHIEMDAKDIDTLEDPKVLTNFKYIDQSGEHILDENSDIEFFDESGELKQNLLIKGNNLLALYTLREKLAGQVKLIYIDPPYNTGNDGFRYNDSFNHSSWLIFMKNRLDIAQQLLSPDGSIFISCDDNEQAYLKVLMDEVFGMDNFINCISVNNYTMSGPKVSHAISGLRFPKIKEYLLLYAKNRSHNKLKIPKIEKESISSDYNLIIPNWKEADKELYELDNINKANETIARYSIESISTYCSRNGITPTQEWKKQNSYRIFASNHNTSLHGIAKNLHFSQELAFVNTSRGIRHLITTKFDKSSIHAHFDLISAENGATSYLGDSWTDNDMLITASGEGGVMLASGQKPEKMIARIIETATSTNDIVLDYHLGSGTTAAVAHKLGLRWIGIEQMDYIDTLSKKRLQNVVNGEQTGISRKYDWQGGGSFIYLELKKYNQDFVDRIMEAITIPELEEIYKDMQKNAFLKFFFDKNEFEKDENFRSLSLDERKQKLVDILDENQLYLNYAEMNDTRYHVSETEKVLTDRFYQTKEESEDAEE